MARKSTKITVNFKGVEGRSNIEEGRYKGTVTEVAKEKGDKGDYLAWKLGLENADGDSAGVAFYNTSLTKQSLWNLRGLLEAMGEDVPDDEMDIDLSELVDKEVGVVMGEDDYNGKTVIKMVDYFPADELEGDKKGKKKKKKDSKKKTVDKDDVEGMDRDDLEEFIKEHKLDVDPDDFKKDKKLLAAVLEAAETEGLFETEDEGKGGKKKKAKKLDKLTTDEVEKLDEDELKDVVKTYNLDLDLDDYKSLRKMQKAVIEKLEEGNYIKE